MSAESEAIKELAEAVEHVAEELHEMNRQGLLVIIQDKFPINSDKR